MFMHLQIFLRTPSSGFAVTIHLSSDSTGEFACEEAVQKIIARLLWRADGLAHWA